MNQFFYDELKCASTAISACKVNPGVYAGDEINIIGDEHSLSAYLAGLINLVITTLISYFGHKYYSFKKEDENKKNKSKYG